MTDKWSLQLTLPALGRNCGITELRIYGPAGDAAGTVAGWGLQLTLRTRWPGY